MRGSGRLVALVTALGVGLLACAGQPFTPVGLGDDDHQVVGGSRPSPLIGTWRVILLIDTANDLQRWTTRWTFLSSGKCHFSRTTESIAEGVPRTVDRDCAYLDRGTVAEVTWTDTRTSIALPYSVPLNSTTRLVIEGLEYERVP